MDEFDKSFGVGMICFNSFVVALIFCNADILLGVILSGMVCIVSLIILSIRIIKGEYANSEASE